MGESLEFRELLNKKKTLGEWRVVEELTPIIEKLVEQESLMKLMDSTLRAIDEALPGYRYTAIVNVKELISRYFLVSVLDEAVEYVTFKTAWEKLIPYITLGALSIVLDTYIKYMEAGEEEMKALWKKDIEKYARLLKEYAEKYADFVVKGLLLFVNIVNSAIEQLKREIKEFGRPLT
jgi:hypothetical protein